MSETNGTYNGQPICGCNEGKRVFDIEAQQALDKLQAAVAKVKSWKEWFKGHTNKHRKALLAACRTVNAWIERGEISEEMRQKLKPQLEAAEALL